MYGRRENVVREALTFETLTLFMQRKDGYQYTDIERRIKTFREFVLIPRQ